MILVPGRSFSAFKSVAAVSTDYVVIGPIAEGGWVAGAWCTVTADAAVVAGVAASLGESNEGTANALRNGVSLVQKSDVLIETVPALQRTFSATGTESWVFPVGIRVLGGPKYVVWALSASAEENTEFFFGVEVFEILKGLGGRVGARGEVKRVFRATM